MVDPGAGGQQGGEVVRRGLEVETVWWGGEGGGHLGMGRRVL